MADGRIVTNDPGRLLNDFVKVQRYLWPQEFDSILCFSLYRLLWSLRRSPDLGSAVSKRRHFLYLMLNVIRIALRAFQGIGGGGIYSLVFVIGFQMVPQERYAALSAILSSGYAFSAVLGPILGGLISDHGTWRWVFLLK